MTQDGDNVIFGDMISILCHDDSDQIQEHQEDGMTGNVDNGKVAGTSDIEVRIATLDDAPAVAAIYRYYVETSAATFEYIAPDVDGIRRRMAAVLDRYPYFVAVRDGDVIGFTYASPLRTRPAYDWSCETTIYVSSGGRTSGVGRALYQALEDALKRMGVLSAYACVARPHSGDEHLTDASLRFHERMGYAKVGEFADCGNKFGRWYDIVWMKKDFGSHEPDPVPVVLFCELG